MWGAGRMARGPVKWFSEEKDYGFIRPTREARTFAFEVTIMIAVPCARM